MSWADRVSLLLMLALATFALLAPWLARRVVGFDWCGCCGRRCDSRALWCGDCAKHVTGRGWPSEQTWYATHDGEDCPYSGTWAADPMRGLEETRLMPGYEQRDPGDETAVPEGLGVVRPPRKRRAVPSRTTPFRLLSTAEQALWRDALEPHA